MKVLYNKILTVVMLCSGVGQIVGAEQSYPRKQTTRAYKTTDRLQPWTIMIAKKPGDIVLSSAEFKMNTDRLPTGPLQEKTYGNYPLAFEFDNANSTNTITVYKKVLKKAISPSDDSSALTYDVTPNMVPPGSEIKITKDRISIVKKGKSVSQVLREGFLGYPDH